MKTIEFRIPMPATVDEYLVGQNWAVNEQVWPLDRFFWGVELSKRPIRAY